MSTAARQEQLYYRKRRAADRLQTDTRTLPSYVKRGLLREYVDGLGRSYFLASEVEAVARVRPVNGADVAPVEAVKPVQPVRPAGGQPRTGPA